MDIAAGRLGLDPAELRAPQPGRADVPVRDARAARLRRGRLPRLPRAGARAVGYEARRAEQRGPRTAGSGSGSRASSSRRSRTWATSRSRRRPTSAPPALPKSGNVEGCIAQRSARTAASRCASRRRRRARDIAPSAAQIVADRLGVAPEDVEVIVRDGHLDERLVGVVRRLLVALLAASAPRRSRSRPTAIAAKVAAIRAHLGEDVSLRRVAGVCHWNPESLPAGMEPGPARPSPTTRRPDLRPARRRRPRRLVGRPRLHRRHRRRRDRRAHRAGARARLRHRPRRRAPAEPAHRRRPGARRLRPRRRPSRSSSACSTTSRAT